VLPVPLPVSTFTGDDFNPGWGLRALETVEEIGLVAIPDLVWQRPVDTRLPRPLRCCTSSIRPAPRLQPKIEEKRTAFVSDEIQEGQRELLRHCELLRDRF